MTVERDIAGFAFPFAAGIALAAVFFKEIFSIHPAAFLPTLCLWGISENNRAINQPAIVEPNSWLWSGKEKTIKLYPTHFFPV